MIHSLDNKANTFYEQHTKLPSPVSAIAETAVFPRVHNYPAVARITEPQMVSLPPDTALSCCYYNTVVLNLSITAITSLEHLCRQPRTAFIDCTDDIMIQNGKIPKRIFLSNCPYSKQTGFLLGKTVFNFLF